jgi:hypothetical protein
MREPTHLQGRVGSRQSVRQHLDFGLEQLVQALLLAAFRTQGPDLSLRTSELAL